MTVNGASPYAKSCSSAAGSNVEIVSEAFSDGPERPLSRSLCKQFGKAIESGNHKLVEQVLRECSDLDLGGIIHLLFTSEDRPYTRNLLFENEKFAVLGLVWRPGAHSSIHAHNGSSCWVRVVHGSLWEQVYVEEQTASGKRLNLRERRMLEAGRERSCAYVDDSLGVHCMANGSLRELSVSIHVYAPPFYSCNVFSDGMGRSVRSARIELDAAWGRALRNGLAELPRL